MGMVETISPYIPQKYKNSAKHVAALVNRLSPEDRMLPGFLIIGAQKAGTSSLFKYLMRHGNYLKPLLKDVYFFDENFHKGLDWYKSFFPSAAAYRTRVNETGGPVVTGEGATYYLLHPLAPQRVHQLFPDMKLVVLLRDPVDRAISHYYHNRRFDQESEPTPEAAFALEAERLAGEEERLRSDPNYKSHAFKTYSYLARGRYAEQLERWFEVFPRDQVLIACSEEFYSDSDRMFRSICSFIGLPERSLERYPAEGAGGRRKRNDDAARSFAREHFREPNERLFDLLERRFLWK